MSLDRLGIWLCRLTLGALVVLLGAKAITVATLIGFPDETTYPEAANVYVARRVMQGEAIYGDWRKAPHVASWYGPALYAPVAYVGRYLGAAPQLLFVIGRAISVLSVLATSAFILHLLRRYWAVPTTIAVIPALIFLTADDIWVRFDVSFRPDAPACLFSLLGIALLVCCRESPLLYGSAILFLPAFLYKQSSIAGPLAAVLWLLLEGRKRAAVYYALLVAVAFGGISVLLNLLTEGRYFLNTVEALGGNATPTNVPSLLADLSKTGLIPLGSGVFLLLMQWRARVWDPVAIAFLVSTLLSAVATYRDGSNIQYYVLPLALACVLFGRQLSQWWRDRSTAVAGTAMAFVMVLSVVRYVPPALLSLAQIPQRWAEFSDRAEQQARHERFLRRLGDYLNGLSGPVLCQFNSVSLYCPGSIMVDTGTFTSMADQGVFDEAPLIEKIREGQLAAIVLDPRIPERWQSTDSFSRRWRQAMGCKYRAVRIPELEPAMIYVPVTSPGLPNR